MRFVDQWRANGGRERPGTTNVVRWQRAEWEHEAIAKDHCRRLYELRRRGEDRYARDEPEADEQKDAHERELLPDGSGIERVGSGRALGLRIRVSGGCRRCTG